MNLNVSQQITQTLTTELIHQLELLQYSSSELEQHIYEKSNENPLLTVIEKNMNHTKDIVDLATMSIKGIQPKQKQQYDFIQTRLTQQHSYITQLLDQIPLHLSLTQHDREILKYFIHNLDEHLFLNVDLSKVAKSFNISLDHINTLLDLLQTFEPLGVGVRNMKEYLLIQIYNDIEAPPFAAPFIQHHLEQVANLSIKLLSTTYDTSIEETQRTIQYIRNLKPIPASLDNNATSVYIIPDIIISKLNGEWIIELNNRFLPKIEINQDYVDLLKESVEDYAYYQQCMNDIIALTQGIAQRDKTLYSLTRLLLDLQASFFEHGIKALYPMRLKDVAQALNMHESTISRAVKNKFIRTAHGIFALQSLFTKGIINDSGKLDSVSYIKSRIKKLVENENRKTPLSDQQLTEKLETEGIRISRRTVSKYRKELNIANSSKRIYL
ncbi:RNA polymerase factor sigma-54 [Lysinibacillus capsici]|uniref:RNA polymerase factor sigma-54 n=1 Tax=Lysinibacillus capsici TaxID=2115968 RepID=UPI002A835439|nr:RNA polymerase factor sigma-54 [Lysinibacillus capsici]